MNGFTFKAAAISLALLSTAFLPSLTFATNAVDSSNKTKILGSAGCMSCHQGETIQSDETSEKNRGNLQHQD